MLGVLRSKQMGIRGIDDFDRLYTNSTHVFDEYILL
jgi:hypothetical protein